MNPSADYPDNIHTPIDTSNFGNSKLGSTNPKHSEVHGKIESEIVATQTKLNEVESEKYDKTGGKIGGETNYSEFEPDGMLAFHGEATVWNDSMTPANLFRTGGTALTFIDCGNGIFLNRFDVGDIFYVQVQLPHDYKENTVIYPHLHLLVNSAIGATGYNVEVTESYSWGNINDVFPIPTVVSTGLVTSFQNDPQYTHKIASLGPITPTATQGKISSFLMFKVERITASVQPITPANSIFILGLDIHYECDTVGSRDILVK